MTTNVRGLRHAIQEPCPASASGEPQGCDPTTRQCEVLVACCNTEACLPQPPGACINPGCSDDGSCPGRQVCAQSGRCEEPLTCLRTVKVIAPASQAYAMHPVRKMPTALALGSVWPGHARNRTCALAHWIAMSVASVMAKCVAMHAVKEPVPERRPAMKKPVSVWKTPPARVIQIAEIRAAACRANARHLV